jgi:seryl-tRNA synthetase
MIDLVQLRREPDVVMTALRRRGVDRAVLEEIVALDLEHRRLLHETEALRAAVKELSRQVGDARRNGDLDRAETLSATSRDTGDQERRANEATELVATKLRDMVLLIPNVPDARVPDGIDETGNVEVRRWWPGMDGGAPFPVFGEHQRVPHWEIGESLGILDLATGAKIAGSMFPLYRGGGSRLLRALSSFSLDRQRDAYEEIRPPTFALTETMMSTGSPAEVRRRHVRHRTRRALGDPDQPKCP